jgi:hypothetical protein
MRRRSRAPGRRVPDGRRLPFVVLLLVLVVGACGQAASTNQPGVTDEPGATDAATPSGTIETPSGEPSGEQPTTSVEPTTPDPSTADPTDSPAGPTTDPGSATGCTGSDENRDFFASMAAAVDWTVYCPVLPDGWFVADGQYRLAGGGWMRINYDGPGDAGILLQQGAFCTEGSGCVPGGQDAGQAAFGDRTGTIVAGGDGSWSIVVDRGAVLSWLLVVTGLDEASARTVAADLRPVAP